MLNNIKLQTEAICMVLRYGYNYMKVIFDKFPRTGVIFMEYINIYLYKFGGRVGYVRDFESMVPNEILKEFMSFKDELIKSGDIVICDKYFFLPHRNEVLGYSLRPTYEDISEMRMLRGRNKYNCNIDVESIKLLLFNVTKEITAPLSVDEIDAIKFMQLKYKNPFLDSCLRITDFYLRHSTRMIGIISDRDITARIVDMKAKYLSFFVKDDPCMYIDADNCIFCDSSMRKSYGYSAVPQDYEIKEVKDNFRRRVNFINNVIKNR